MWNKVRVLKGKDFNAEAVHDDKYLTTKIKFFANEIKRDFHDDGIPQEKIPSLTYVTLCIDSDYRSDKIYHPQTSFNTYKYVAAGNKILKNFDY